MGKRRIKRSLGRITKKRVGSLDIMERQPPTGNGRIAVYADTETWYVTYGLKPWEHIGKPHAGAIVAEMTVFPCIISWQYPRRNLKKDRSDTYEAGGWIKKTRFIQYLDHFEEFMDDMSYIYNEWRLTPTLYFHNSMYDIPVIEPLLRELDPDIILYTYVKPTDKGFIRGAFESKKYNVFWEFGDTWQYDKSISIAKAGEILGKPKIKGIPYGLCDIRLDDGNIVYEDLHTGETKTYPKDKYMEYAERDVDIMRELNERKEDKMNKANELMVEGYDKMDKELFNKYNLTISAHSKKIANTFLKQTGWTDCNTTFRFNLKETTLGDFKDLYYQTIKSNHGGFTTYNKGIPLYDCPDDMHIKYYDRNSMYPTIMTEAIPYGDILTEPPSDPYVTWYSIAVDEIEWKEHFSCMRNQAFGENKCNGKPFFCLKEYFDFVMENANVKYTKLGTYYQRKARILAPLIKKYYDQRKNVKDAMKILEKDGLRGSPKYEDLDNQQASLKLLMNALYGKLCEKGHLISCVYSGGEYHKYEEEAEYYPCILTGSFITYMGRLSLLNKIKSVLDAGHEFLYCDTDSVILACPKDVDLTSIFGVDRGNLGEWKEEGTFDLFLNKGDKKKYALFNRRDKSLSIEDRYKLALSGIHKSVQEIIKDQLKLNFDRVMADICTMFNPKNNVLIKNCKPLHVQSNKGGQQIIYNTDFLMNRRLKRLTHVMTLGVDDYQLKKCENK